MAAAQGDDRFGNVLERARQVNVVTGRAVANGGTSPPRPVNPVPRERTRPATRTTFTRKVMLVNDVFQLDGNTPPRVSRNSVLHEQQYESSLSNRQLLTKMKVGLLRSADLVLHIRPTTKARLQQASVTNAQLYVFKRPGRTGENPTPGGMEAICQDEFPSAQTLKECTRNEQRLYMYVDTPDGNEEEPEEQQDNVTQEVQQQDPAPRQDIAEDIAPGQQDPAPLPRPVTPPEQDLATVQDTSPSLSPTPSFGIDVIIDSPPHDADGFGNYFRFDHSLPQTNLSTSLPVIRRSYITQGVVEGEWPPRGATACGSAVRDNSDRGFEVAEGMGGRASRAVQLQLRLQQLVGQDHLAPYVWPLPFRQMCAQASANLCLLLVLLIDNSTAATVREMAMEIGTTTISYVCFWPFEAGTDDATEVIQYCERGLPVMLLLIPTGQYGMRVIQRLEGNRPSGTTVLDDIRNSRFYLEQTGREREQNNQRHRLIEAQRREFNTALESANKDHVPGVLPVPPTTANVPGVLPVPPTTDHVPGVLPVPTTTANVPGVLPVPPTTDHVPGVLPVPPTTDHVPGVLPVPPTTDHMPGVLPVPPTTDHMPGVLPVPTTTANVPGVLPVPPTTDHVPGVLPVPTTTANVPGVLPVPPTTDHVPGVLPVPTTTANVPGVLPVPPTTDHVPGVLPVPTTTAHVPGVLPVPPTTDHVPGVLPVPPTTDHVPGVLPVPPTTDHVPGVLPVPPTTDHVPGVLPVPTTTANVPGVLPVPPTTDHVPGVLHVLRDAIPGPLPVWRPPPGPPPPFPWNHHYPYAALPALDANPGPLPVWRPPPFPSLHLPPTSLRGNRFYPYPPPPYMRLPFPPINGIPFPPPPPPYQS
ncbi:RGAG1 [Branchiostoma lanceolatum]|uniref:RGAG1 protein n=1 Tax=Branchiostoma lanceolatum TaxID=7740 RepID=A0A8S4MMS6_BRALA|nr:RGAG1 [Branchiostoma lanceolatum]